jgi:hypothetical protein
MSFRRLSILLLQKNTKVAKTHTVNFLDSFVPFLQLAIHIFNKCFLCDFTYVIGIHVCLLLMFVYIFHIIKCTYKLVDLRLA